ncbi:MAG: GNAT family N-acetyltransferase [Anaerolineae bacterium]
MLDKSLEYKGVIMKMDAGLVPSVSVPEPPQGYAFRLFTDGDEIHWARLEASVLEFATETAALDYFVRDYMPYVDRLKERCVFVTGAGGVPVATATSWWADSVLGHQASLHWVSVDPAFQGKGLGRAVVSAAVSLFAQLEPGEDVWLHTQTWSHVAIRLYRGLGFRLCKTEAIAMRRSGGQEPKIYPNEYAGAIEVLRAVMDSATIDELVSTAR